jgi:hypothetical protein
MKVDALPLEETGWLYAESHPEVLALPESRFRGSRPGIREGG